MGNDPETPDALDKTGFGIGSTTDKDMTKFSGL
jgi:hypothetical protein